ncbi:MAG: 50S ribosomal protein P1 [archaeon]|jgi:large subunit ribosomal protein L12|nr:50S ribosomal protein P1 [archaeon]MDD2477559.1 50S ribosomal protein P1 [Candidatus ainarchaeum sp.]MDD3084345.1 50S ribosomal protein P1 [Candidatus ainarchaeum sp.]MDD4221087.1 50S ribosomal protein P1 [Candidatus ainarchaeum sp.]MDD4662558.1 50S ribosomal protein P1 [Candidatus ainarchaeum sp.]
MDYIYAALLLHNAKKEINENNLKSVISAVGIAVDDAKIKGLVATLKEINISEAIEKASMPVASAPVEAAAEKKEEVEEVPEVTEEAAAEGLGSLFG